MEPQHQDGGAMTRLSTLPVPEPLRPYVNGLLAMDCRFDAPSWHRGLPCDSFLLTVLDDSPLICRDGSPVGDARTVVCGVRRRAVDFDSDGEGSAVVALLTPLGFVAVFGGANEPDVGERYAMARLVPRRHELRLRGDAMAADDPVARLQRFAHWIEQRSRDMPVRDRRAMRTGQAALTLADDPSSGLDGITRRTGLTRRQLERDFRRYLGVSPAHYLRNVRLQGAMAALGDGRAPADVAFDWGFSDQSHMTRAMQEAVGNTPGELARTLRHPFHRRLREAMGGRTLLLPRVPDRARVSPAAHDLRARGRTPPRGPARWPVPASPPAIGRRSP